MAIQEARPSSTSSGQTSSSAFSRQWDPAQTENVLKAQQTIFDSCQQASQAWIERMQSEITLWSDFASRLAGTRTLPEAFDAYTKCLSRRAQMAVGDSNRLLDEAQQMMQKMSQSFRNEQPERK